MPWRLETYPFVSVKLSERCCPTAMTMTSFTKFQRSWKRLLDMEWI